MARKHSKSMKTRRGKKARTYKKRQHRQRGGGWGYTGVSSIPGGTAGIVNNGYVATNIGDCRAVRPGYDIPVSQYGASMKGLPGMSGGKRTRKQRGGRYGFFPEGISSVTPNGAAWWAGGYPPVQRIGCEGSTPNPLNAGPHTPSTAPPGAASPNYYLSAGKGLMSGGAQQMAPASYGVGNVDSMYYYAPTGGYANSVSTWKDSVGAPVQIQVPVAAREMNQACLTTGGAPPLTGALQKGGKRTRKQRGGEGFLNNIKKLFGSKPETVVEGEGTVTMNTTPAPGAAQIAPLENNKTNTSNTSNKPNNKPKNINAKTPKVNNPPMLMGGKRRNKKNKSRKARKANRKH